MFIPWTSNSLTRLFFTKFPWLQLSSMAQVFITVLDPMNLIFASNSHKLIIWLNFDETQFTLLPFLFIPFHSSFLYFFTSSFLYFYLYFSLPFSCFFWFCFFISKPCNTTGCFHHKVYIFFFSCMCLNYLHSLLIYSIHSIHLHTAQNHVFHHKVDIALQYYHCSNFPTPSVIWFFRFSTKTFCQFLWKYWING